MPIDSESNVPREWRHSVRYKPLLFDLLDDVLLLCIFVPPLFLLLSFAEKGAAPVPRLLFLIALIFGMTLARRLPKKEGIAFLLRGLLLAAAVFIPAPLFSRVTTIFVAVVAFFYSYAQQNKEKSAKDRDYEHPQNGAVNRFFGTPLLVVAFFVLTITMMVSVNGKQGMLNVLCVVCFSVFLAVYEVYRHLSGICALTQSENTRQGVSSRRFTMFFSTLLGAGVGLFACAIVFILQLTGLNRADSALLRLLYGLGGGGNAIAKAASSHRSIVSGKQRPHMPPSLDTSGSVFWMQTLLVILKVLGILLLCALALALLYVLLRLVRGLGENINEEKGSLFSVAETAQRLRRRAKGRFSPQNFFGGGNTRRLRRLYYKTVRRREKKTQPVVNADTPEQILHKLAGGENLRGLTGYYEKARYSGEECTQDDVKQAKRLADSPSGCG